jgi:carbon storage regulator
MLVLSRKQGESLQIGDQITITIVRMSGNSVRVAIEAPRDVNIVRTELIERDQSPRIVAAS